MSSLSRDQVAHLASLARIEMTDAELDTMAGELAVILDSVAQVGEVAADDVPPMSHPMPLTNVTRPDEVRPGLTAAQALSAAPEQELDRFQVPRILSED
ncbi:Asp-tRNA(Asn)/Glu-tRNA(Gln) amidotransferase subunit GatC [Arsenicicoccus dermatophilus]|uniref:Asp-tRNA(Asn)/Glu-tRNA(Gln) amidotransferase subunit GatC n=1 Tax=Arsenicicoccus dermatophilus TaxID=1076331 RepID=UPI0039173D53